VSLQIAFTTKETYESVVVLIRWKFDRPLSLVRKFRLKVRKGTIEDMDKSESENIDSMNQSESEIDEDGEMSGIAKRMKSARNVIDRSIEKTSTSYMLTIKTFQKGI
jgi:hypothetical protein